MESNKKDWTSKVTSCVLQNQIITTIFKELHLLIKSVLFLSEFWYFF